MAIPPSAGNPVKVGPYKRIVGFHWPPTGPDPYAPMYIATNAQVLQFSGAEIYLGETFAYDGVSDWPPGDWDFWQNYSIKTTIWEEYDYFGSRYFPEVGVYDSLGNFIEGGAPASIGVSITAPSLPYTVTHAPWEWCDLLDYDSIWPDTVVPYANPVGTYYSDGGILYATGFKFSGSVEIYKEIGPFLRLSEYMYKGDTGSYLAAPLDMRGVSATYLGNTYTAVGFRRQDRDPPLYHFLLKKVETPP